MAHQHQEDNHVNLSPARLEAFSDGVMAIIITIAVLAFKLPQGSGFNALIPDIPLFIVYAVSFHTIGTYWNNHHHLLKATKHVSAGIMWANLHLLFWLSFIPFATSWLGEHPLSVAPTIFYLAILLCAAFAYLFLQQAVIYHSDKKKEILEEFWKNKKGLLSIALYIFAIFAAFLQPVISDILVLLVIVLWFIPDRRIERVL